FSFLYIIPPPPRPTLFPYTTLFRSVMFGCLQYHARVMLADGRTEKIGKIVNQRLPVEVLSYDPSTGRIQPRRVVNWFDNGRADQDRKSTRLNSSHLVISYAVFCLKK